MYLTLTFPVEGLERSTWKFDVKSLLSPGVTSKWILYLRGPRLVSIRTSKWYLGTMLFLSRASRPKLIMWWNGWTILFSTSRCTLRTCFLWYKTSPRNFRRTSPVATSVSAILTFPCTPRRVDLRMREYTSSTRFCSSSCWETLEMVAVTSDWSKDLENFASKTRALTRSGLLTTSS